MLPNVISLFACLTATVPPTSSPQHSRHPAQDEAPHTAVNRSQVNRHKSRNVLRKLSVRRMASCACRATVSASPGGAVSCFKSASPPLNSSMTLRPHRPEHDVCRKRPITRWTLFHETPSPYFRPSGCQSTSLEPQAKLWASVCMHHSRRYHTGWLSFVQHRGFPRYDLHKPLPGRIFFSTFHFE